MTAGDARSQAAMVREWQHSEKYRAVSQVAVNDALVAAAKLNTGHRVLEIGAGTGETTHLLADRVGHAGAVTAVDASAAMLEQLTTRVEGMGLTNVTTVSSRIEDAKLPDEGFDAAVGRYVLMLVADPTAVLARVHRALRPGARAAMAVFASAARNPFLRLPLEVVGSYGELPPAAWRLFRLGEPADLAKAFADAGFADVTVHPVPFTNIFSTPAEAAELAWRLPFVRAVAGSLDPTVISAIEQDLLRRLTASTTHDGEVRIPGEALIASGSA